MICHTGARLTVHYIRTLVPRLSGYNLTVQPPQRLSATSVLRAQSAANMSRTILTGVKWFSSFQADILVHPDDLHTASRLPNEPLASNLKALIYEHLSLTRTDSVGLRELRVWGLADAHLLGRLVAPMTMTCARDFSPSISVSSCDTIRRSTSPCAQHARDSVI